MDLREFSLEGKVALITGAGRGIGRAAALGLARAGADIAGVARTTADLEELAGEVKKMGRKALAVPADIKSIEATGEAVKKVRDFFGKIDIMVSNAGPKPTAELAMDIGAGSWDAIMDINLKGFFFITQAVARVMKETGGGSIINISSRAGLVPGTTTAYSISKAGIIMATKVMAKEWGKFNIRVNVLAPGIVKTDFTKVSFHTPDYMDNEIKRIPLGRIAEPEDMVGTIIYLASEASRYVTGAVIAIDGGRLLT